MKKKKSRAKVAASSTSLDNVDDAVLSNILLKVEFPTKNYLPAVCTRWKQLSERLFVRCVKHGQKLLEMVASARAGDTILAPPALYQETIVVDRPLKFVGGYLEFPNSPPRLTCLFSIRPPVVVCNARCMFVNIEIHTNTARVDSSIVSFGPACSYIRFEHCKLTGLTGIILPYRKGPDTHLTLIDCEVSGTRHNLTSIAMETGQLVMTRCKLSSNATALDIGPGALAHLQNCELVFNNEALVADGAMLLENCRFWANAKLGCYSTQVRVREAQQLAMAQEGGDASSAAALLLHVRSSLEQRRPVLRMLGCEVEEAKQELQEPLLREARKQARRLVLEVYGEPEVAMDDLEMLVQSDLSEDAGSDDPDVMVNDAHELTSGSDDDDDDDDDGSSDDDLDSSDSEDDSEDDTEDSDGSDDDSEGGGDGNGSSTSESDSDDDEDGYGEAGVA